METNDNEIDKFEISLGDVTDMQAFVYTRYTGPESVVTLRGELRGPFCEVARTLPADFPLRDLGPERAGVAEAIVTDPCLWSPDMRHVYHIDVAAMTGEQVVAEYHGSIGLQRLAPRRPVDFAPGTG
jgi:hypothetical protein